jgi:polyisoprenoid-binding protein YceI
MRRLISASMIPLVLLGFASIALAQPMTFTIDRAHSEVGFGVRHFFNKVRGTFTDYSGTITFDPERLAASAVEVTIRDSSIYTANARRDRHLRSEDFFWVEKHPHITFKSTRVIPGKDTQRFQVAGDLTIRGKTRPVTLDVEYLGMAPISVEGRPAQIEAGWVARTKIDRKDFDIVWNRAVDQGGIGSTVLGDEVEIELNIAAVAQNPPAAGAAPQQPQAPAK